MAKKKKGRTPGSGYRLRREEELAFDVAFAELWDHLEDGRSSRVAEIAQEWFRNQVDMDARGASNAALLRLSPESASRLQDLSPAARFVLGHSPSGRFECFLQNDRASVGPDAAFAQAEANAAFELARFISVVMSFPVERLDHRPRLQLCKHCERPFIQTNTLHEQCARCRKR